MKKILLHIILLSYTALLFKPVMPHITDFVEHVFFYAKHIATVHVENGKFHVHVESAKNINDENESGLPQSLKKDNSSTEHTIVVKQEEELFQHPTPLNYLLYNNNAVAIGNIEKNYPPPRC
ncbi:MAG TPA: hypothetical protein PK504_12830 [Ferruginibacter sp.]|nr:hypothetical protein [Ferruginibacter sp.]HRE63537.1 hypothetical protein [Ferruginibacter sp.]